MSTFEQYSRNGNEENVAHAKYSQTYEYNAPLDFQSTYRILTQSEEDLM